jgi:1-acyl-sn-glycerol-3-phosphate acyltransferase
VKSLSFLARRIWCGWFFLSGFIFFLPLYPIFLILLSRDQWFRHAFLLKKVWAHCILFSTGIFYRIRYEEKPDCRQAAVICPNHASYLDIVLANVAMPCHFHFMGKAELKNVPLFNIFFKKMNIAVDRNSITAAHRAYQRAVLDIKKGIGITIFPEATIPDCSPQLGPFKNGAFKLAIETQTPIIPITFLDNWKLFPDKNGDRFLARPGISRIIVHKAIPTTGLKEKDIPKLKEQIRNILETTLREQGGCK